jgi:CRP-like cAMP-binding protein
MNPTFYDDLFPEKHKILQGLLEAASKKGAPVITEHLYKPRQDIFYSGTEPFGVYYIHHGIIKLFKSGKAGRQHITFMGGKGDLFGYRALLTGELYKVTAESLLDSKIAFIEKEFFVDYLKKDKLLVHLLLKSLSMELGEVEDRLVGAAQVPAEQRVARVLCFLIKNYGVHPDGFLNMELSRTDMSELSDTAPETLMRYLGDLEKKKFILREKKRIKILKPDALQKEAGIA